MKGVVYTAVSSGSGSSQTVAIMPDAVEVVREILKRETKVYLLSEVTSNADQGNVLALLEAAGIVSPSGDEKRDSKGESGRRMKRHHVLFCSTSVGKVAMVRQLEPDVYIDNDDSVLSQLSKITSGHVPRLVHVWPHYNTIPDSASLVSIPSYSSLGQWGGIAVHPETQLVVEIRRGSKYQAVFQVYDLTDNGSTTTSTAGLAKVITIGFKCVACSGSTPVSERNLLQMHSLIREHPLPIPPGKQAGPVLSPRPWHVTIGHGHSFTAMSCSLCPSRLYTLR